MTLKNRSTELTKIQFQDPFEKETTHLHLFHYFQCSASTIGALRSSSAQWRWGDVERKRTASAKDTCTNCGFTVSRFHGFMLPKLNG
ncbi:hypothetical protein V6Z11_D13G146900 [Gossypium hirsutum]